MDNRITISQNGASVTMPRVRDVQVGGKEFSKEVTMASGKIIKYVLGHRVTVTAGWDWAPADTLTALAALLRRGGFFQVEYPAPGGMETGMFSVAYPTMGIFSFRGGVPRWHDVKLTMEAQEVI